MPPDPKPLREQPTRNRILKPVELQSVRNEKAKTKDSKAELQALASPGSPPSALQALAELKEKFKPTVAKPSSPSKRPPFPEPEETEREEEELTPQEERDLPLPGREEERQGQEPQARAPGEEPAAVQEAPEEAGQEEPDDGEEASEDQKGKGSGSLPSEMEEDGSGESVGAQPSPSAPPHSKPAPSPAQILNSISPDVSRQIDSYLKQVQLHALEQADRLLQDPQALNSLPALISTVKDLAELQVMLRYQAKFEKEILKGKVPPLPHVGRFPGLSRVVGSLNKLKKASGEAPTWAGELPE